MTTTVRKEEVSGKKYEYDFPMPSVTLDIVIFSIINGQLMTLLIKRKNDPFKGSWALPGGFLNLKNKETLEEGALRELEEETGVKDVFIEQLYTFGDPDRDPRGRVITVAFYALVASDDLKPKAGDDAEETAWSDVNSPDGLYHPDMKLAFDHAKIINMALERIKGKISYTSIAYQLLPKEFTLTEIQKVYEIILGKSLDKRNFRKCLKDRKLVIATKKTKKGAQRPARLYTFNDKVRTNLLLPPVRTRSIS